MEVSRRSFLGGAAPVVVASLVGVGGVISYLAEYSKERDHAAAILENKMYDWDKAIVEDRDFDYDFAVEENKMYNAHAAAIIEDRDFDYDPAVEEGIVRSEISSLSGKWEIGIRMHSKSDARVLSEFGPGTYGGNSPSEDLLALRDSLREYGVENEKREGRFVVGCIARKNDYTFTQRFQSKV